ncbi:hypothetical protein N0V82_001403 [Gnomoniopsis sp. IMI 355080]|nr:hypothetical protein N0V82_001403 [Gnomoniopsis sp. IMI 355080]
MVKAHVTKQLITQEREDDKIYSKEDILTDDGTQALHPDFIPNTALVNGPCSTSRHPPAMSPKPIIHRRNSAGCVVPAIPYDSQGGDPNTSSVITIAITPAEHEAIQLAIRLMDAVLAHTKNGNNDVLKDWEDKTKEIGKVLSVLERKIVKAQKDLMRENAVTTVDMAGLYLAKIDYTNMIIKTSDAQMDNLSEAAAAMSSKQSSSGWGGGLIQ